MPQIQSRVNGLLIDIPPQAKNLLGRFATQGDNQLVFVKPKGVRPADAKGGENTAKPVVVESITIPASIVGKTVAQATTILEGLGLTAVEAEPKQAATFATLNPGMAKGIFVATPDDLDNINIAMLAMRAIDACPHEHPPVALAVRIDREDLANEFDAALDGLNGRRRMRYHRLCPDRDGLRIELVARGFAPGTYGMHVHAVGPSVQRHGVLVLPRLRGQGRDRTGRHVRRVDDEHVDAPAQLGRQRVEEVAEVDAAPERRQVRLGAGGRSGIDVGSMQRADRAGASARGDRDGEGAGPAAQVHDHRRRSCVDLVHGDPCEHLGPPPRDEHPGRHGDPPAAEPGPADDLLQRLARHPPPRQLPPGRVVGRALGNDRRLVLSPDAPGRTQRRDELGRRRSDHAG